MSALGAVSLLLGALTSVHCSSTAETGCKQLTVTKKPGETILCLCADGTSGTKVCQKDKTFAECAPCAAKVACPAGLKSGDSSPCTCPDGAAASQPCNDDGTLGECGPCGVTSDAGPKKDGGPSCNNDGNVDPGEACDDGNGVDTDDCTSTCTLTTTPKTNACPGQAVAVWDSTGVVVSGSTDGYTSKHAASAPCNGGISTAGTSPDRVYAVTVMKDSVALDVTVTDANFEHSLWVNTDCAKPTSQVACADTGHTGVAKEALSVPNVKSGATYFVWIDGEANTAGTYKVRFRVR